MNLCEFCDLSFSSICPKYNKNYIKGMEKGCVSFYCIILVFGCCPGAWQPVNSIVTSVTPIAGSLCASRSDARPARCVLSQSTPLSVPRTAHSAVGSLGAALSFAVPLLLCSRSSCSWRREMKASARLWDMCTRSCITLKAASPEDS